MLFHCYVPRPPLSDFVDCFWLCADAQSDRKERILPSGTIELIVNLRDDEVRIYDRVQPERYMRFSGAIVSGTYSQPFLIDAMQHASIMGVHFKPGGAFPFLGTPASELADWHADLSELWGSLATQLRERLCSVAAPHDRFRLMEEVLIARLHRSPDRHPAVAMALDAFDRMAGRTSVRKTAERIGLSQRRFIEVFTAAVGLTPKLFCRVLRFQFARALTRQTRSLDWAELAAASGYFDQSHLISDFKEFSGLSPTEYLRQRSDDCLRNHVPLAQ